MFSVVYTVLLRPLPFAQSDRIVTVSQKIPIFGSSPGVCTADEFQRWQKSGLFDHAALIDTAAYTLENTGGPEQIYGAKVTPDFFRVFKLQPILGREFVAADATEGRDGVVVLSHELWVRDFASDPKVVGTTVRLSGVPMTVIGVMPAGFNFPRLSDVSQIMRWAPEETEFWTPLVLTPKLVAKENFNYYVLGRLRAGVTPARAASQFLPLAVDVFKGMEIRYPAYRRVIERMITSFVVYVTPLRDSIAWGIRGVLWMLLAAVALLLLLVLFNLGNLLLTRNAQRMREYTVRQALGASSWQLFRQSFFEQTVLIAAASVLAALITRWAISILKSVAIDKVPRLHELRFSFAELAVLLGLAFLTALVFGALSQLLISEKVLAFSLNSQGRTSTADHRTNQFKYGLIAAEIAVSAVLLVGSGLLLESFYKVMAQGPGFNTRDLLTVEVPFNPNNESKPQKYLQHVDELITRLEALPGVVSASVVNRLPLTGDFEIHNVHVPGKPIPQTPGNISAEYRVVDAAYFRTLQIPVISGRDFRPDDPTSFAVINQEMARRLCPPRVPWASSLPTVIILH
jgi:predicted permease